MLVSSKGGLARTDSRAWMYYGYSKVPTTLSRLATVPAAFR